MSLETQNSLYVGTSLSISQAEENDWQDKDVVDGVDSPQGQEPLKVPSCVFDLFSVALGYFKKKTELK